MKIRASVADELVWDTLPVELRSVIERLFYKDIPVSVLLDEAEARGYRNGYNQRRLDWITYGR